MFKQSFPAYEELETSSYSGKSIERLKEIRVEIAENMTKAAKIFMDETVPYDDRLSSYTEFTGLRALYTNLNHEIIRRNLNRYVDDINSVEPLLEEDSTTSKALPAGSKKLRDDLGKIMGEHDVKQSEMETQYLAFVRENDPKKEDLLFPSRKDEKSFQSAEPIRQKGEGVNSQSRRVQQSYSQLVSS